MRRVLAALLAVAILATSAATSAGAAPDGPELSRGGQAEFPHRSYVLTLPAGRSIEPSDVSLLENGQSVHELSVTPAGSASDGELGTMLVIDASNSMAGAPIRRAMEAARAFAAHRNEAHKLGVVTFNNSARVVLPPTTDAGQIESALAEQPRLAEQTHARDAAVLALKELDRAEIGIGSLVLLSDGADTGSRASLARIGRLAESSGVRIFTIGLDSRRFDPQMLESLAKRTGGEFTSADSPREFAAVFEELGSRLSNEHLVEYSSVLGRGVRVKVEATVDGFTERATATYRSPELNAPAAAPSPEASGFWSSAAVMVAVGFGAAFLVCFAIAWFFLQRRRPQTADERVAAFVATGEADSEPKDDPKETNALYERLEQGLAGLPRWQRFALDIEIAQIKHEPVKIAVGTGIGTLLTMWLFVTISGAAWVGIFALAVPFGVNKFVTHRADKTRSAFGEQLADNLQVLASAMRAGQSFAGALAVAVEDAPQPAKHEFERVVADEQLGVPLESALGTVVERMENRDLHQVALVAALQREAGGNSAEVLDRVSDTIRDRVALRRLIASLTAQGRLSRWVVSLMPIGVTLFIGLTNPGYLDPLFHTTFGNVVLVIAVAMGTAGSLLIKKIVEIKV